MYQIKREDRQWVDEFRQQPIGHHSPNLQRVLNALRGGSVAGKHVLVCTRPHREWVLATLTGRRGDPVQLQPEHTFTDLAEAEWFVFKLRWKLHTGETLN